MKFALLFLIGLMQWSLSFASWSASSVLLLGDSLSASYGMKEDQGWVHLLNQQLVKEKRHYRISNASISGETTGGGLARLPDILSQESFDYLLIELGGNDGLRGFPPKVITQNLKKMIQIAQAKQIKVLVMQIRIPPNYGPRYNQMFEGVFPQVVADSRNVQLLPFFMDSIAINPELMLPDGIHPNQEAQPLIAQQMAKTLAEFISP